MPAQIRSAATAFLPRTGSLESLARRVGRMAWVTLPYAGVAFYAAVAGLVVPGGDGFQYWSADPLHPYGDARLGEYGYLYSPAFVQVLWPLQLLPWEAFRFMWVSLELAALVWLAGPWIALFLLVGQFPLLIIELNQANANLLVAAAVWAGLRHPAAWAFPLLTKVTPGIGVVWFAFARDWRRLSMATGATVAVVAGSLVISPSAWAGWIGVLAGSADASLGMVILPLPVRLLLAFSVVAWGGLTGRYWTVAVGAILAHPAMSTIGWLIALGFIRHAGLLAPRERPTD